MNKKSPRLAIDWKQHFRVVPARINTKLKALSTKEIIVASTKKIRESDIQTGKYAHLGISLVGGQPGFPGEVVPPSSTGRYSAWNIDGREVVRRDLPKITKTYTFETPNWGDWTNGSHDVDIDREVYQRELWYGQQFGIGIELLVTEKSSDPQFTFKFAVRMVLNVKARDFQDQLLFAVNLLQENTGVSDVFPAAASKTDFLRYVHLDWQLLPPGERDAIVGQIIAKFKRSTPELKGKVESRYDVLKKHLPTQWLIGTDGFRRYFGAQFLPNLVVFENLEYGNATYVMYEQWAALSKLSRTELLRMQERHFERVIHGKDWKATLSQLIKLRISELRPK